MKDNFNTPVIAGLVVALVLFATGMVLGGGAMFFYKIGVYDKMNLKYGECVVGHNKVSLKLAECQTDAVGDLLEITDELVACKEGLILCAEEEALKMK